MQNMTQRQFDKEIEKYKAINRQHEFRQAIKEEKNKYGFFHNMIVGAKTSNKLLFVSVIAIIVFTVISLFIQYVTGVEVSSTLTTCWFSFFGGEIVLLAGIKVSKVIKGSEGSVG